MLISHARDGRPNFPANSLRAPEIRAGRLGKIAFKSLMSNGFLAMEERFLGVTTRFLPAVREKHGVRVGPAALGSVPADALRRRSPRRSAAREGVDLGPARRRLQPHLNANFAG
jgi:hypothetical protein